MDHLEQPKPEIVQAYYDQRRLSADHKAILDAFAAGGTYEKIAAAMNLKAGTVKSRLNRARSKVLRLQIEDAAAKLPETTAQGGANDGAV